MTWYTRNTTVSTVTGIVSTARSITTSICECGHRRYTIGITVSSSSWRMQCLVVLRNGIHFISCVRWLVGWLVGWLVVVGIDRRKLEVRDCGLMECGGIEVWLWNL